MDNLIFPLTFVGLPMLVMGMVVLGVLYDFRSPWMSWKQVKGSSTCFRRGHQWHEGADTAHKLAGQGSFYYGTYTWRCLRCGASTVPCEPPPPNEEWDYSWCSPDEDPHKWPGEEGRCYSAYRSRG